MRGRGPLGGAAQQAALGTHLLGLGHRVAVVAVDPSSSRTGRSFITVLLLMLGAFTDIRLITFLGLVGPRCNPWNN